MSPLTDFEKFVLDFERVLRGNLAEKHEAINRTFAVSPARYLAFLDTVIRKHAALEHDPLLVSRLRRLRDARIADWRSTQQRGPRDDRRA